MYPKKKNVIRRCVQLKLVTLLHILYFPFQTLPHIAYMSDDVILTEAGARGRARRSLAGRPRRRLAPPRCARRRCTCPGQSTSRALSSARTAAPATMGSATRETFTYIRVNPGPELCIEYS